MSIIQIGLADKTGKLDANLLQQVAAALNIQVNRDLSAFWNVKATVSFLPSAKKIPSGFWPVMLVGKLPPDEGGFHLDKHNQPYAEVVVSPEGDGWTIAASHEILEMLVDPYGNRLQTSRSIEIVGGKIQDGPSEFAYLVEACDPCEADQYAYSIQGVAVSDFITPHFYDPVTVAGTRYSFTGAITAPRQILPGGYISWIDQQQDEWKQLQFLDPNKPPTISDMGPAQGASLREWVHKQQGKREGLSTPRHISLTAGNSPLVKRSSVRRRHLDKIAAARSKLY